MQTIEHDPMERPGRRYSLGWKWLFVWAFIGILWLLESLNGLNLEQLGLGFITGLLFGYTVIDAHLSNGGSVQDL